jgi:hypothetical protein
MERLGRPLAVAIRHRERLRDGGLAHGVLGGCDAL